MASSAARSAANKLASAASHKKHGKGNLTPAQLAADRANLVKARARHAPKTAAQLAASRANLVKARAARKNHGTHHGLKHTRHMASVKHRGRLIGYTPISMSYTHKLTVLKPTGRNKHFVKRLSPSGYNTRTSWKSGHQHHFHKRLHPRRTKSLRIAKWGGSVRRLTPR